MDTIRAMQAFVGVVDAGSFTKAAELLKMPKATVSTSVAELEAHLETRLLHRTTRRVTVTPDGAAYYERCVRLLEDLRDMEESFSSRHGNPSGRLRVDVSTAVASRLLIPALPAFFERYPGIQLELGCSDRAMNLLSEGVDCALRAGEILDQSLVARRVGTVHVVTCATRDYLARRGRPLHPHDLKQHVCLSYLPHGHGHRADWDFSNNGERIQLSVDGPLALTDSNAYVDACLAGLGVGQLPTYIFNQYLECGALEIVLGEWLSDPMPFHVIYPSNRHLSSKVRAFVEWVAETFEHHTGMQMCASLGGRPCAAGVAAAAAENTGDSAASAATPGPVAHPTPLVAQV